MSGNFYWGRIATEAGPYTLDLRYDDGYRYHWIATHEATGEEHDVGLVADEEHEAVGLVITSYGFADWQLEVWSGRECIHS